VVAGNQDQAQAIREADEARRTRARRDAQLSPAERLARVHELCRQLASIRPVAETKR
jgi:hypothetical protein